MQYDDVPLVLDDHALGRTLVPVIGEREAAAQDTSHHHRRRVGRGGELRRHGGKVVVVGETVADEQHPELVAGKGGTGFTVTATATDEEGEGERGASNVTLK